MLFRLHSIVIILFILGSSCINRQSKNSKASSKLDELATDTALTHHLFARIEDRDYPNTDSAFLILQYIIRLSESQQYLSGIAKAFFLQGNIYYQLNQFNDAFSSYNEAKRYAEELHDDLLKAKCLERMASVKLTIGDDHVSFKLYYEALPLFEKSNNKEGIAKVYNILGLYYSGQRNFDTAELYYRKAIKLNQEIKNLTGLVHNKGNLGYLYENAGKYQEAGSIYQELINSLLKEGDSLNLPVIYYNFSSLYQKLNLADSAIYYLNKAIKICEVTKDSSMLSTLYGNLGELYMNHNNYSRAIALLNLSTVCAAATGDKETQVHAIRLLLNLDTLSGDYKRAIGRLKQIFELNDSVNSGKIEHNYKAIILQYEVEQKSNLLELQGLRIKTAENRKLIFKILFLTFFIVVCLLSGLIWFIVNNQRKRKVILEEEMKIKSLEVENALKEKEISDLRFNILEEEIRIKEREQMADALALEQKNELLAIIYKKFSDAIHTTGSMSISDLNGLVSTVKLQISENNQVDVFNQKFGLLHSDFYDKLKNAHPELTKSEIKFCAYLRLNLSGSQIAKLANVTTEAIRKSRYRIRKKLNLQQEDSLEDYLLKL